MTFAMSRTIRSVSFAKCPARFRANWIDTLYRNDDGSSSFIDLSNVFLNGLNFYGSNYNGLYVNNNGNVTFGSALSCSRLEQSALGLA